MFISDALKFIFNAMHLYAMHLVLFFLYLEADQSMHTCISYFSRSFKIWFAKSTCF